MELSASDINEIHEVKVSGPGTMLVPVAEEEQPVPKATGLKRFMVPGLIAAGVLVGIGVGALIAGGGSDNSPQTAVSSAPAATAAGTDAASSPTEVAKASAASSAVPAAAQPVETAAAPQAAEPPPPPEPVAQVYLKLLPGDKVAMNGNPQALVPSPNGFAMLQLPPGDYRFSVSNNGQTRSQTITVDSEGVWLLNPQS